MIAIENARLFEAEQTRTKELQEAFDRQSATSDVLGVISRSPSETQPVFDVIVATAARLCRAEHALIYCAEVDGAFRWPAASNADAEWLRVRLGTIPSRWTAARSLVVRLSKWRTVHLPDCLADPEFRSITISAVGEFQRTMLGVPLRHHGEVAGVIGLLRNKVVPFLRDRDRSVSTFADQATIAIENARLFASRADADQGAARSLEYQTATSEVLSVISPVALARQPVLETIVAIAERLCHANHRIIFRCGKPTAFHIDGYSSLQIQYILEISKATDPVRVRAVTARAARERRTIHVADSLADPEYARRVL